MKQTKKSEVLLSLRRSKWLADSNKMVTCEVLLPLDFSR